MLQNNFNNIYTKTNNDNFNLIVMVKLYSKNPILLLPIICILVVSGCSTSIKQIGKANMLSNRNIDSNREYIHLKSYAGSSKKEIKKAKCTTIDEAINKTVKSVPGGEFLTNVNFYLVDGKYYMVEGDVWGRKVVEFRGFKLGDTVQWKTLTGTKKGTISGMIDSNYCMVKEEGAGKSVKKKYDKITKVDY